MSLPPAIAALVAEIDRQASASKDRDHFLSTIQIAIEELPGAFVSLYITGPHRAEEALKARRAAIPGASRPITAQEIQKLLRQDATLHGIEAVEDVVEARIEAAVREFLDGK